MAVGKSRLDPTKSIIESLNLLIFQKNQGGREKFWIKPYSLNGHQRKFNTFFVFNGDLIGQKYYILNVIK